jgi:hypothetical protein
MNDASPVAAANNAPYILFKTKTAIKIQPIGVEIGKNGYPRPGGYMVTIAGGGDETKVDWKGNSISIMIGANEAMHFVRMLVVDNEIRIYHDPDKGKPGEGTRAKSMSVLKNDQGLYLNIFQGEKKLGIGLKPEEVDTIRALINSTLAGRYGW